MSGQQPPPWKDDPSSNDNISPPNRAGGRSNNNTPGSSAQSEEQRSLLRHILTRGSEALESAAAQPGMPERSDYPSHEAWLRALLTASLQQSDEARDVFGHDENADNNDNPENPPDPDTSNSDPGESKQGE